MPVSRDEHRRDRGQPVAPGYGDFGQAISMIGPLPPPSRRSRGIAMQDPGRLGSQKFGLWCNWIFVLLTAVGWLGIAHFYMPARADLGLDATKVWFSETHHWGVIIGCTLFYIAAGILTPGSITFGIMLAKIEGRWPLWSLTTAVCGVFISLIVFFNACAWIVSAYRKMTCDGDPLGSDAR
jgi:hypothetical protein